MHRIATVLMTCAIVSACAGQPVVTEAGEDKVTIEANGAPPDQISAKANEACGTYRRIARHISAKCGDGFCVQNYQLFACVPTPQAFESAPKS